VADIYIYIYLFLFIYSYIQFWRIARKYSGRYIYIYLFIYLFIYTILAYRKRVQWPIYIFIYLYLFIYSYIQFWRIARDYSGQFENILDTIVLVAFCDVTVRPLLGANRCFRCYLRDTSSVCAKMLMSTYQKICHNPEHQKVKNGTFCFTLAQSCMF